MFPQSTISLFGQVDDQISIPLSQCSALLFSSVNAEPIIIYPLNPTKTQYGIRRTSQILQNILDRYCGNKNQISDADCDINTSKEHAFTRIIAFSITYYFHTKKKSFNLFTISQYSIDSYPNNDKVYTLILNQKHLLNPKIKLTSCEQNIYSNQIAVENLATSCHSDWLSPLHLDPSSSQPWQLQYSEGFVHSTTTVDRSRNTIFEP